MQESLIRTKANSYLILNKKKNDKCGKHKIQRTLRQSFIKANQRLLDKMVEDLEMNNVFGFPRKILYSVAKIQKAYQDYRILVDYEYVPNYEDLKDFTGGAIGDTDIANYEYYFYSISSLDEVAVNEIGEIETFDETIDDCSFAKQETDDILYESLNFLPKEEKTLLMMRFGLSDYEEHSCLELASIYHVTKDEMEERVTNSLNALHTIMDTMM